jgi:hypothetical protein
MICQSGMGAVGNDVVAVDDEHPPPSSFVTEQTELSTRSVVRVVRDRSPDFFRPSRTSFHKSSSMPEYPELQYNSNVEMDRKYRWHPCDNCRMYGMLKGSVYP